MCLAELVGIGLELDRRGLSRLFVGEQSVLAADDQAGLYADCHNERGSFPLME